MKFLAAMVPLLVAIIIGYPLAAMATHGYHFNLWPTQFGTPLDWYGAAFASYGQSVSATYLDMAMSQCSTFADGGGVEFFLIFGPPIVLGMLLVRGKVPGPRRAPQPIYGGARFANAKERKQMRVGLELGRDRDKRRVIRVAVKSNLISIAPPRTGKTSGLLLPNLVAPERAAWFGPVVVFDPKGDTYKATVDRRTALGRTVRCLDPFGMVGGQDHWNPLENLDPHDILYLQRTAAALLPAPAQNEPRYFRDGAVTLIVGAMLVAHHEKKATPEFVARLLSQPSILAASLRRLTSVSALSALATLEGDPKTAEPLLSTARQAFDWCADERLQHVTGDSSFDLIDICRGDADLFVPMPTENLDRLGPFLRWILNDLFNTIRHNKPHERIMIFVDETRAFGRFDELVKAYGELPGYNASIWTFWQNRSQMKAIYGEDDTKSLIANCEILTFADPIMADPDEIQLWSDALGDYSMIEETETITEATKDKQASKSISTTVKAVPLMSRDAVATLPASELLVIVNSQKYAKRPLHLLKTPYTDARLKGLVKDIGGTAASG